MLSINNNFHEIEHALSKENKRIKAIANEMSVGENKLRRMLVAAGYEYDSSTKKWRYIVLDESKDVRNMSFLAFDEQLKGNTSITKPSRKNMSNIESNISNKGNAVLPFSSVEIEALRELAQLHINKQFILDESAGSTAPTDDTTSILERVQSLQTKETNKKTFVIDREFIKQFDAFCEMHRLKKSDVMSIAIIDLIEKYK